MVSIDKIAHLAECSGFDRAGPVPPSWSDDVPTMDLAKVAALGRGTKHDVCASSASSRPVAGMDRIGDVNRFGICHSFTHDGRCVSLFKTLFTNYCFHECGYCPNACGGASRGSKAYSYTPDELARLTLALYRGNYIEGLFLSSGAGRDEDLIMERIVETARLLRERHAFQGYIHLKVLPGSSKFHIEQAMRYADRLSINIEAPSAQHLDSISSTKDYETDILQRQRYIRDLMSKVPLPAGQTTQLVVGSAGESDLEIFSRMQTEYREMGVRRAYFSAFVPVAGTAFSSREAEPFWREHRLYQVDWLYRVYGLGADEIGHAFDEHGLLADADPKVAVARAVLDGPVDPNTASYNELIRVPGIGPVGARRIIARRKLEKISKSSDLAVLGVRKKALSYLLINGWATATLDRWL